jgi:hypothetical protein
MVLPSALYHTLKSHVPLNNNFIYVIKGWMSGGSDNNVSRAITYVWVVEKTYVNNYICYTSSKKRWGENE